MNLIPFAILTFCIHHTFGQEPVSSGDYIKSTRSVSEDQTASRNSHEVVSQQKVNIEDTPDEFEIKRPAKTDKQYDDFYNFLHRNDKATSKVKREISTTDSANDVNRGKRMIIFRPLFVYKQQEVKRQKVGEQKKRTKKPVKPTKRQG